MRTLALMALFAGGALAQTPGIDEIMARVAQSQAKSLAQRRAYVYDQEEQVRMRRTGGKLAREEKADFTVTPSGKGVKKTLVQCSGKYEQKGKFIGYSQPGYQYKGIDLDGALVQWIEQSTDRSESRDGISHDYFPLTAVEQAKYIFTLEGTEVVRGRRAYRVRFEPRRRAHFDNDDDEEGVPWRGVALIDAEEHQPIRVTTDLAWKFPAAVKILLGTNIKGLGFAISYERMDDGVWFPVSFGGEFEIRGLFLYKRIMSVSLVNKNFRHTDVTSAVEYSPVQ